jgi:DinB superfamily
MATPFLFLKFPQPGRYKLSAREVSMGSKKTGRPDDSEFSPFYKGYISHVIEDDAVTALDAELAESLAFFRDIEEQQSKTSYGEGKWTIRQVLGHIVDTERVMSYRALRFARNDKTELPGFEQDDFIRGGSFNEISMGDMLREFEYLRRANILMFRNLATEAWDRRGSANGNQITVRALAYIIVGHEKHHRKIVKERYLGAQSAT